jgi:hypothetical protein
VLQTLLVVRRRCEAKSEDERRVRPESGTPFCSSRLSLDHYNCVSQSIWAAVLAENSDECL